MATKRKRQQHTPPAAAPPATDPEVPETPPPAAPDTDLEVPETTPPAAPATEDNSQKPVAQVPVAVACNACPKCGSTKRGKIYKTSDTQGQCRGGLFRGEIYDYQIRRWCACANCGQRRVIVEHHRDA